MTVPVSTVSSLYDLAAEYLAVIVSAMATTAAGAPDRAWVSPGQPAWETECAQACVFIPALTEEGTAPLGPPMQLGLRHKGNRVNLVTMAGFAVRCAEVSEGNAQLYQPPFDASLSGQGRAVYEDGWAIWNALTALLKQDLVFGGPCGDVHFDLGLPLVPQGAVIGWQQTIRVELNGYTPTLTYPPTITHDQ